MTTDFSYRAGLGQSIRRGHIVLQRILWCLALVAGSGMARGQLSQPDTLKAEQLGEQGIAAYNEGRYAVARQQLEAGYALSHWGTIGVWLGKTYEALNEPQEAFRVYSDVGATPALSGEPEPFVAARAEARLAAPRVASSLGVVRLVGAAADVELSILIDGRPRAATQQGSLGLSPGRHVIAVSWHTGEFGPQVVDAVAGRTLDLSLMSDAQPAEATADAAPASVADSSSAPNSQQSLELDQTGLAGWALHDVDGKLVCTLPCRWSGQDAGTLTLRQGKLTLPIRLSRRWAAVPNVRVMVNPARGSKGWSLGLGIPSGILFVGSLAALPDAHSDEEPGLIAAASIFGAGLGACVGWFLWSKSHPYVTYEEADAASQQALGLGIGPSGVGLHGVF